MEEASIVAVKPESMELDGGVSAMMEEGHSRGCRSDASSGTFDNLRRDLSVANLTSHRSVGHAAVQSPASSGSGTDSGHHNKVVSNILEEPAAVVVSRGGSAPGATPVKDELE